MKTKLLIIFLLLFTQKAFSYQSNNAEPMPIGKEKGVFDDDKDKK